MIVGSRIRQLRMERGITSDQIEEFSGLDQNYIARVEQGLTVPPLETLERIAAALAVPLYWLFYAEDDPFEAPPVVTAGHQPASNSGFMVGGTQFLQRLKDVSGAPWEVDPAFLIEFARRTVLGKLEN